MDNWIEKLSAIKENMLKDSNEIRVIVNDTDSVELEIMNRIDKAINPHKYLTEVIEKSVNIFSDTTGITLLEVLTRTTMERLGYPNIDKYRIRCKKIAKLKIRLEHLDGNRIIA